VEFVGLTCAACHTGNVRLGDRSILIEGAPSMLNFDLFLDELVKAMVKTRDDPAQRSRFIARFDSGPPPDMKDFGKWTAKLEQRKRINTPDHPAGFGRVDAFGHIFNQVSIAHLGNTEEEGKTFSRPNAPASYPMLWDIAQHLFVQWNYSAPNMGVGEKAVGSLMRNIGEVLGVFGEMEIRKSATVPILGITSRPQYLSSARIENLQEIEGLVSKLRSPQWPFDQPSQADVDAGQAVYAKYCEECHATTRNPFLYPAFPHKVAEVGTDPDLANTFQARKTLPGNLAGSPKGALFFSTGLGTGLTSFEKDKEEYMKDLTAHLALNTLPDTLEQLEAFKRGAVEVALIGKGPFYKARPLNGIWASAPYLHNGSVPTLWDLLLPEASRPKTFCVGDTEYDTVKVGYKAYIGQSCPERAAPVDTAVPGSRNMGHVYGVGLTDNEKRQLVEFMKTL
jgi:hypothetical protein